jgi:outer membrane protein TolC
VRRKRFLHDLLLSVAITTAWISPACGESLEEAWSLALAQNHRLAAAQLDEVAALKDVGVAKAEWMPSLALHSAYTIRSDEPNFVVRDPVAGLGTFEFPYAQINSGLVRAEVRLPLYTSGRIENSVLCANARLVAAGCDGAQVRLDLLFAVGEAYITVIRVEQALDVARHELQSLEEDSTNVSRLFDQERVSQSDVLAAKAAETAARLSCSEQERALDVARGRYNRLLGRPLSAPVALEEVTLEKLPWSLEELVQIAYEKRPDLLGLLAIARSYDYASCGARAEAGPQVTALVGTQYEENRYNDPQSLATGAILLDWTIFDGRRAATAANAEQLRGASVRRRVDDLKSQIALDLLDAWNQAAQAAEQLDVANQRLSYATENRRVTRLRLDCGMTNVAAVLDAQAQWSQSMRDCNDARCNGVLAQLRIRYSAGIL